MDCDACRTGLSAQLDGEESPAPVEEVHRHVVGCDGCAAWFDEATRLHRWVRVRTAQPLADRTDAILAGVPMTARPRPVREGVRYALLAIGLTQVLLALPALVLADSQSAPVHITREMGAFELALGVGLLASVWRPRLCSGMLPFAAALAGAMVVTAAIDLAQGQAIAAAEGQHLLALVGVALLAGLRRPPGRSRLRPARMSVA